VEFAGPEGPLFGVGAFDRIKADFVEPDVPAIPLAGVFYDGEVGVRLPGFEHKRAVAHDVARARPW
jgi:small ligand-binding sensory domain FIST